MTRFRMHLIFIMLLSLGFSLMAGCEESDGSNMPDDMEEVDSLEVIDSIAVIDSIKMGPCDLLFPPLDTVISSHTSWTRTNYPKRIRVFQADTIREADIVMLGNSLTEQGGNWKTKLDEPNVKNRGIAGDNTEGVLARLSELICKNPSVVFIMIGTNDLFLSDSPKVISERIDAIGSKLAEELPNARIIVQTIMPLSAGNDKHSKAIAINTLLKDMSDRDYELLDTFDHMVDETGFLPDDFSTDGVHLSSEGYTHWSFLLKQALAD